MTENEMTEMLTAVRNVGAYYSGAKVYSGAEVADAIAALRERIAALEVALHEARQDRAAAQMASKALMRLRDELITEVSQLHAERDALRQALVEQQRIDAQICRTAQDWSDGSLGWNRACERMALAIEKQTARDALKEGKP